MLQEVVYTKILCDEGMFALQAKSKLRHEALDERLGDDIIRLTTHNSVRRKDGSIGSWQEEVLQWIAARINEMSPAAEQQKQGRKSQRDESGNSVRVMRPEYRKPPHFTHGGRNRIALCIWFLSHVLQSHPVRVTKRGDHSL